MARLNHGAEQMLSSRQALRALAVTIVAFTHSPSHAQDAQPLPELDQGWSNKQRDLWWRASQGSRLIPLDWFNVLEISDGQERFDSIDVMKRFGYLARPGAPSCFSSASRTGGAL
jgi:hypothetical protein